MEIEKKLAIIQNMYAVSIAETVNIYEKFDLLDYAKDIKNTRLLRVAPIINIQLGIKTPEEVVSHMVEVFGCANWKVEKKLNGFSAIATSCKLSELCKKAGGANPCNGWCLNPMRAMILAIDNSIEFTVKSTLMDGDCCLVEVKF